MTRENGSDTGEIVSRARQGDRRALDELFSRHREQLRRMVRLRLDARLQGRIDDSDVLQEVYLEAARRLEEHLREPNVPFVVWLRGLAGQKLVDLHRHHLGTLARDPRREVSLRRLEMPEATSAVIAARLLGRAQLPSEDVLEVERARRIKDALDGMDERDREVLVLRHFEGLTNRECAHELDLSISAASKRYVRALGRLREVLAGISDGWASED